MGNGRQWVDASPQPSWGDNSETSLRSWAHLSGIEPQSPTVAATSTTHHCIGFPSSPLLLSFSVLPSALTFTKVVFQPLLLEAKESINCSRLHFWFCYFSLYSMNVLCIKDMNLWDKVNVTPSYVWGQEEIFLYLPYYFKNECLAVSGSHYCFHHSF